MAASVTANLTLITNGEDDSGDWGNTDGTDTEVFIQNTGSESWYVAKNNTSTATFDAYSANGNTAFDMSATDTHLYFWIYSTVALLNGTKDNSGLTVRIEDGSANYKEWKVAGRDTWDGRWTCFIQNINATADSSSGTLSYTDIQTIKFYVNASGTSYRSSPANYWIDVIRFGTGLTITGTAWDFEDVAAVDEAIANKYGVINLVEGVLFCQGRLIVGDATGSVTTTLSSANETLYFLDRPVSTGLYKLSAVASGSATTTFAIDGLVCKTVGTTRADIDFSDTDLGTCTLENSTFLSMGLVSFDANTTVQDSKFNNCLQIDPSTASFTKNTISNYVGTEGGSLLWPGGSTCTYCTFANCDYGIEITQVVDQTFTGHLFDDEAGNYDVGLSGGTSITVTKAGLPAANPNSYYDHTTSGDTVTFVASINIDIHVEDQAAADIASAYVYIDEDDESPFILNTTTDGNGEVSDSYSGAATSGILRIRKYGYKPYKGTVSLTTDINVNITLITDPQQT